MAAVSRRYLVANFFLLRAVLQYVVSMESGLHAVLVSAKWDSSIKEKKFCENESFSKTIFACQSGV